MYPIYIIRSDRPDDAKPVAYATTPEDAVHIGGALHLIERVRQGEVSMLDARHLSALALYCENNIEVLLASQDRHVRALLAHIVAAMDASDALQREALFDGHRLRPIAGTYSRTLGDAIERARRAGNEETEQ